MSRPENLNENQSDKRLAQRQDCPNNKLLEEGQQVWAGPVIITDVGGPPSVLDQMQDQVSQIKHQMDQIRDPVKSVAKDTGERVQGAAQGFVQACSEVIGAVTHPGATANNLVISLESIAGSAQLLAGRISEGESNKVIQEIGTAIKKAGEDYLKMPPQEQGQVIGHDVLPILALELPAVFRGVKAAEATSKVIAVTNKEAAEETLSQTSNTLGNIAKQTDELANYIPENSEKSTFVRESEANFIRKSQLKDDGYKYPDHDEEKISQSGEHLVSIEFLDKLDAAYEKLLPMEKDFLAEKGIEVKGIRRAIDIANKTSEVDEQTRAFYDPDHKIIYIAEQVEYKRRWIPNHGTEFLLRHEVAHAINHLANKSGRLISESKLFKLAYNKDISLLPPTYIHDLGFTKMTTKKIRDEVFAELYPIKMGVRPLDSYSYKIKGYFSNCLQYLEERMKL